MHLSFKNLNPTTTKNLLSKFKKKKIYIYIYIHQWSFHKISLAPNVFVNFIFVFFELQLTHMHLYWMDIHVV